MSRNLAQTSCYFCHADVHLEEEPRPIREDETGTHYFADYRGMMVANARCLRCCALYLAWVSNVPHRRPHPLDGPFVDLSFRHAFNDEPDVRDLPVYRIREFTTYTREPISEGDTEQPFRWHFEWAQQSDESGRRQAKRLEEWRERVRKETAPPEDVIRFDIGMTVERPETEAEVRAFIAGEAEPVETGKP